MRWSVVCNLFETSFFLSVKMDVTLNFVFLISARYLTCILSYGLHGSNLLNLSLVLSFSSVSEAPLSEQTTRVGDLQGLKVDLTKLS